MAISAARGLGDRQFDHFRSEIDSANRGRACIGQRFRQIACPTCDIDDVICRSDCGHRDGSAPPRLIPTHRMHSIVEVIPVRDRGEHPPDTITLGR
jgi:hypothetical protein